MKLELVEIPGVRTNPGDVWKIRALMIDGVSPALRSLVDWEKLAPSDFKKILKSMALAAKAFRTASPKHVKRCEGGYPKVYEMRADKGVARLMFFYDEQQKLIICTNGLLKSKENQNNSFHHCDLFRQAYFAQNSASQ